MAKKLEYNTDYLFNYDVKESVNSVIDEVDGLKSDVNGLIGLAARNPVHYVSLSNKLNSTSSSGNTYSYMFMVPVQFSSVRVCYNHLGGSGTTNGIKAVVSASDDIGDLTYLNTPSGRKFTTPWEGGSEINTLSSRGWKKVTWSGADSITASDLGANNVNSIWSDTIECQSRPVIDNYAGRFSGYYPVIVRFYATGQLTRGSLFGFSGASGLIADCGARVVQGGYRSGDSVTNPTLWSNAEGVNMDNSATPAIAIEFLTGDYSSKSFISVGDSRFAIASPSLATTKEYYCTQWLVEQKAIAGGDKYSAIPSSQSGKTTRDYANRAFEMMKNGSIHPNFSIYLAYSINNGLPTRPIIDECKFLLLRHVNQCVSLGVTPIIVTAFPSGTGYTSGQLSLINELVDLIDSMKVSKLSPLQIYGDANGGWINGFNEDSDHMTPSGYEDLADRLYNLMKSLS